MRPFQLLLLALAACDGPTDKSTDATDETDPTEVDDSDPTESDPAVDTDGAGPDDTEIPSAADVVFEEDFESPVLSTYTSTAPAAAYTSRISTAGNGALVIARKDSNEVASETVTPPSGSQFLVLSAQDAYGEIGFVRVRHEAFVDVVSSMVDGTTYTLTVQVAVAAGDYDPTIAFLRLINPLQKGQLEDGSWPQFTGGAYTEPNRTLNETFQELTATYHAGPADVGMPLTLSIGIQSADEVFPVAVFVDDVRVVAE
jgi:hypothetical protein